MWWVARLLLAASVALSAASNVAHGVTSDHEFDLEVAVPVLELPLETAATLRVAVEIRNLGRHGWSAEYGDALAYHWLSSEGEVVEWDGLRTPLVEPVPPDARRVIEAALRTPDRAGDYLLVWDIVREREHWVSQLDPTPPKPQPVRVVATHAFSFVEVRAPRLLTSSHGRVARVVVRNDGTRVWSGDGSFSMAYHWLSSNGRILVWEGRRAAVDAPVKPGETIALEVEVTPPTSAGRVLLQWDMVEEGVCWFAERDPNREPPVVVVVLPQFGITPIVWSTVVLAVALVLGSGRDRWRGLEHGAVIAWVATSLVVKQGWVLASAGLGFSFTGAALSTAVAAVVGLAILALPRGARGLVGWVVVALATTVLFADDIHLRFFGDLGSVAALRSAGQLGMIEASIRTLLEPRDLWFWLDLLPGAALVLVSRKVGGAGDRRRIAAALAAVAVVAIGVGLAGLSHQSSAVRQVFNTAHLARHIGVLQVHALDAGRFIARLVGRSSLGDREIQEIERFFDERRVIRRGVGPLFAAAEGRNLIMIQVESLQAFVVGLRVGGREVTPFLNSLARESVWFGNITDQTEEGRSSDSELATQVSLLPPDRGAAAFMFASNSFTGVASILGERGYTTLSAVPFDGSFWNRRTTHRAYGYQRSLFVDDFETGENIGWGLNDRGFLLQAADRLTDLDSPWCAFLLTLSLHHPFEGFPDAHKELDVGDWADTAFGNYLHTMHFFDRALAEFVAALDDTGLLQETVIALWGDHDAGFEWRPDIATVIGSTSDARGWYLSQQVPLVIRVPGLRGSGGPIDIPGGHVDVAPTLLALFGVDPARYAFLGRNLLGEPGDEPVIGEYRCWRDRSHLFLRRGPTLTDGECIELATMRRVPHHACAAGFEASVRRVEVSTRVLEHDLQRRVHLLLVERP
jgi:phosphoglycerol transferase MdoB-like AlkP superfamily enzyme